MNVIEEVAAERARQITKEGWTEEHDDAHEAGQLAVAGACYARYAYLSDPHATPIAPPPEWPWHKNWWKPKNERCDLIRAAALIVAEIERLDRAALKEPSNG